MSQCLSLSETVKISLGQKKRDITCEDVCPYAAPRSDFFNVNCKHDHTFL